MLENKTDVSVIILDIDKFKNINDTYGHQVGDVVIVATARMLQEKSRKSDITSRWGGEEFVILLPNTNTDGAIVIAEKIRLGIEGAAVDQKGNNNTLRYTVSIGVHQINVEKISGIEDAIAMADRALYEAKNSGRNTVRFQS
jgi:diguanylate cyclase (GGDEF)-like protein